MKRLNSRNEPWAIIGQLRVLGATGIRYHLQFEDRTFSFAGVANPHPRIQGLA